MKTKPLPTHLVTALSVRVHVLLVLILIAAVSAFAQSARITSSFDRDWLFLKSDAPGADKQDLDDAAWRTLDVPHDWSIEGPADEKNSTGQGGGFMPAGVGWYRKHFTVPSELRDRLVFIEFDGVMANSDVWINGFHLGNRPYGYVSFSYELTPHINFGKDNVIAVRADTSKEPASRWYTGAGIYRHVRLVIKTTLHIAQWGAFVTTPRVTDKEALVRVNTEVTNDSHSPQNVSIQLSVRTPNGKLRDTGHISINTADPGKTVTFQNELTIKDPLRWDLNNPALYTATATLSDSTNKVLDDEAVSFGIREFHFDPATGFWLNGKNFKIKGACLHHDGGAFGAAVPLAVWEHRLNELRKLGVNAIRTAHNPPAPEFLALTDRMGFIVMDELFDQWTVAKNPYDYHLYFNEWSKIDLRDTVRRDRNHPSVIIYSAGNEIHDTPNAELAKTILRGLVDEFHRNDPTRPVTQGLFRPNVSHDYDNGLADLLDVVGQNYREQEILAAYRQKPARKILGTENTHELVQWLAMRDHPEYSGQFIWSAVDYLGEAGRWPRIANNSGLLYKTGAPKPIGFQRQSWWSDQPMVYVTRRVARTPLAPTDPGYNPIDERRPEVLFSDWTPKNLQPHEETVEVYSNCEEVELFLNGSSLGKQPRPKDDSARVWKVNFSVGVLKGVGYNGGRIVATHELRSAGSARKLLLSVDKSSVANDWNDVAFVNAYVVDEMGNVVPDAENLISFKVAGAGFIAAVDSANSNSHEPYQASQRSAYQGMCLALIKARANKGKITITATSPGLRSASMELSVSPSKGGN
ncbi:MAG TPA: glycoside hydrolase family 2 TIM barrel-domain containing protein [Pyrinomonadaceae bacterium]|jgi:beta-galactosidase|nr:glycoside hydrolase family 2 TIM barrel-domain containing protein [Pyrinomonadaceae bacterium]